MGRYYDLHKTIRFKYGSYALSDSFCSIVLLDSRTGGRDLASGVGQTVAFFVTSFNFTLLPGGDYRNNQLCPVVLDDTPLSSKPIGSVHLSRTIIRRAAELVDARGISFSVAVAGPFTSGSRNISGEQT